MTISNAWLQRHGTIKLWIERPACYFASCTQFPTGSPLEPQFILKEILPEAISGVLPVMSVGRPFAEGLLLYTLQPPDNCNPRISSYTFFSLTLSASVPLFSLWRLRHMQGSQGASCPGSCPPSLPWDFYSSDTIVRTRRALNAYYNANLFRGRDVGDYLRPCL